jgi:hypothetical protein
MKMDCLGCGMLVRTKVISCASMTVPTVGGRSRRASASSPVVSHTRGLRGHTRKLLEPGLDKKSQEARLGGGKLALRYRGPRFGH